MGRIGFHVYLVVLMVTLTAIGKCETYRGGHVSDKEKGIVLHPLMNGFMFIKRSNYQPSNYGQQAVENYLEQVNA